MSSTSNSQNLLVNVFRPTYVYDASKGYIPKLVVSNVDSVVGTSATFSSLNVGDVKSNVYIGKDAGNPATLAITCNSSNMTAIGLNAGESNSSSSNSVFVGNAAGFNACNVTQSIYLGESNGFANRDCGNSVYIGFNSAKNLSNASNEIAIGANTIAGGQSNIYIGPSTGSAGSRNIFIGGDISGSAAVSDQLRIGRGSNIAIYGDLSRNRVSINTTDSSADFQVKGNSFFDGNVGIQLSDPTYALTVKGRVYSTDGIRINANGVSNPNIALADDPTTGIYGDVSNGNYSLGFAVGGTSRLLMIDSSFIVNANLQVNGTFGIATSLGSNIVATSTIRMPDSNAGDLDMSGGSIKTRNTITAGSGTIRVGNGFITDTCTNGYIRMLNDSSVAQLDLSGGNISNSGLIRTQDISALGFIRVGGTDISGGNISNANLFRTQDISALGFIRVGGTDISGGTVRTQDISALGFIRVGGTDISGGNISNAGLLRIQDISASGYFRVGGTDISGGNISNAARIITRDISTSQTAASFISGVRFQNGAMTIGSIAIGSGTISNSSSTSNKIGGVDLSNGAIITTDSAVNRIGGVTLSSSNISNDFVTNNFIGGVNLTNNTITASGSNVIGGVTLDACGIIFGGTINGSNNAVDHILGNVRFSNGITKGFTLGNMLANTSQALFIEASTTSNGIYLLKGANNNFGGLSFHTNCNSASASERMRIHTDGNVGIGTTAPGVTLDVSGNQNLSGVLTFPNVFSNKITLYTTGNGTAGFGVFSGEFRNSTDAAATSTTWGYYTGATFTERMRLVNTSGNIGIGTTTPQYRLDVSSGTAVTAIFRNSTAAGQASINVVGNSVSDGSGIQLYHNSGEQGIFSFNTLPLHIWTNNTRRLTILSNGNVGIGTGATNPSQVLDVCGNAKVSGQFIGNGTIPIGGIIMWSGVSAPSGWAICDGGTYNGQVTPDLRGRFILGASPSFTVGSSLSQAIQISNLPNHGHTITDVSHNHSFQVGPLFNANSGGASGTEWGGGSDEGSSIYFGTTSNRFTGITKTTTTITTDNNGTPAGTTGQIYYPPYYVLAYIMRVV